MRVSVRRSVWIRVAVMPAVRHRASKRCTSDNNAVVSSSLERCTGLYFPGAVDLRI